MSGPPAASTGRLPATTAVLLGSAVAGLCAYAFQVLGTRALGEDGYAPVSILWTVQFLLFSILLHPVETWVARATAAAARAPGARAVLKACGWVLAVLAVVGGLSAAFRATVFDPAPEVAFLVPAVGVSYLAYAVARGFLAGFGRYHAYAAVTGAESLVRMLLALVVVVVGATAGKLAVVLPIGAALASVAGLLLASRASRGAAGGGPLGPLDDGSAGRFLLPVALSTTAAQTLLAGGPLALAIMGAAPAEVAVSFVVLTLARAPLVFGYGGLLSRVLPPLMSWARAGDDAALARAAWSVVLVAAASAVIGGATAFVFAPSLTATVFGPGYEAPALFAALSVGGCLLAAGNLLTGQILIARNAERRLVLPWVVALAVGVVTTILGDDRLTSLAVGLALGEAVAAAGLVLALRTAPKLTPRSPSRRPPHRVAQT